MLIEKLAITAFFIMLACGLMLPSDGNHGVLSPKSLSFIAAAVSWLTYVITLRHYTQQQLYLLIGTLIAVVLLLCWVILGAVYDESPFNSQFGQFKIFLTTLLSLVMAIFYVYSGAFSPQTLILAAIYANFTYSVLKVGAAVLHLLGIVDILTFMRLTGFRLMSMDIHGGMIRLQTSVDIATPFLLLFVLQRSALGLSMTRMFATSYLTVAFIAILLSFSRYLMFVGALACVGHWLTLAPLRQVYGVILVVFISIAVGSVVGTDAVYKVVEKRLFSSDNYHSDRTRSVQIAAMEHEINAHPICGKGMGGFSQACIRDHQLPYSYEVQWIAFTMQLGIVGTFLVLLALILLGEGYLLPPYTLSKAAFGGIYLLWLLSGFTNPFLISLTSGILYALFWAAPHCLDGHFKYIASQKFGSLDLRKEVS
jgi:hypothetical protein